MATVKHLPPSDPVLCFPSSHTSSLHILFSRIYKSPLCFSFRRSACYLQPQHRLANVLGGHLLDMSKPTVPLMSSFCPSCLLQNCSTFQSVLPLAPPPVCLPNYLKWMLSLWFPHLSFMLMVFPCTKGWLFRSFNFFFSNVVWKHVETTAGTCNKEESLSWSHW